MELTKETLEDILAVAKIRKVPWLFQGRGMTIGRHIFTTHPDDIELMYHEATHVAQYLDLGVPRFLSQYLAQYLAGLMSTRSHRAAYRGITFEVDARVTAKQAMEER